MTILRSMILRLFCWSAFHRPATGATHGLAILVLILGVTGTSVVFSAKPASAAVPGLQYVQATSAFNSSTLKSATAVCPAGKRVIGTGFHILGAQSDVILDDLIPNDASVTVQAGEDQDGTVLDWRVVAVAVCANPLPGLNVNSVASSFGPAGAQVAEARCRPGTRVIGTGAKLTQGFGQVSLAHLFTGRESVLAIGVDDQDGFSGSWQVVAFAICADPLPGLEVVSASTDASSSETKLISAVCPTGKKALGIGWLIGFSGQTNIWFGGVGGSHVSYAVSEDDDGFSGSWRLDGSVICASA